MDFLPCFSICLFMIKYRLGQWVLHVWYEYAFTLKHYQYWQPMKSIFFQFPKGCIKLISLNRFIDRGNQGVGECLDVLLSRTRC